VGIVGHHLPDRGQTAGHTRGIAPRPRRDVGGLRGRLGHDLPDRGHAAMVWRQRRPRARVATPGRSVWEQGHHLPDRGQAAAIAPCPRRDAGACRPGGVGQPLPDRGQATMLWPQVAPCPRRDAATAWWRWAITCRIATGRSRHVGGDHLAAATVVRARVATPCQLAPTTRSSPVAATRSKLGDVGGNRRPLPDRGQAADAPCPRRDAGRSHQYMAVRVANPARATSPKQSGDPHRQPPSHRPVSATGAKG
jgi:hypothetical protein